MAMGDPGRFRLGRMFRGIRRGVSIRNIRAGIRGLAPVAQFIPGGGFISQFAGDPGVHRGVKGGTHARPSKHGTRHPLAKPSHAHARHSRPTHRIKGALKAIGGYAGPIGQFAAEHAGELLTLPGGAINPLADVHQQAAAFGVHLGGGRRHMNYMNIKAARRAGRRVAGAIRLLHSLERSLPHVRGHKVFKPRKRKR